MLTGESRFHISTPLGIEPVSLMTGSKRVVHWTSETWCQCSEIAGSPQTPDSAPKKLLHFFWDFRLTCQCAMHWKVGNFSYELHTKQWDVTIPTAFL
jgi:hypothetical protein